MFDILMTALIAIAFAALSVGYLRFVLGLGRFRLDGILHAVDDAGGHGLHVFGYRLGNTRYRATPPCRFYHVFLRAADGKRRRLYMPIAGDRKAYLADPQRRRHLDESTARMAARTGLPLSLPATDLAVAGLGGQTPARVHAGQRIFDIHRRADDHLIECRTGADAPAPAWRAVL
ncbi:MAG TPA: hypothetical protein VL172_18825 [Kofleriaceae bacterium]|jgi:hypothetical protein|nr:hypothetical protein [Kofleriaceae bacterium]